MSTDVTLERAGDVTLVLDRGDRVVEIQVAREVASGPRGPRGEPGQQGRPGDSVVEDPGDLTLLFDNQLL